MEIEIGRVTHYYNHIGVAVLKLDEALKLGDKIHILGHTTDFEQRVGSLEVEHHSVVWVKPGDDVALKVIEPVREHDVVYRVVEEAFEPHLA
ncbi:MAG: translation elongation factor-like protein [Anaerolineales bacterium]|nr:translation elongation factor-like protein [Anaerolineales bacterium]